MPCPACQRTLVVKRSRRGKFLACPGFPKCRGTLNLPACPHEGRSGKVCGQPMTEPGPEGTMVCREHSDCSAVPPPPRKAAADKADGEDAAAEAPRRKGARKATTRKATTRKATSRKTTTRKRAAPRKAAPGGPRKRAPTRKRTPRGEEPRPSDDA